MVDAKEADFRERAGTLEPLPGLLDFVEKGREKGMEISLVTNAPEQNVLTMLKTLGLDETFEPVILADDVGAGKPDPAPYNAALEALDIPAGEAVAFEDSTSGIASSVAAGIPTVGIASTQDPEKLRRAGAFMVAKDFTDPELRALIQP